MISVIIPVYNAHKYIKKCIESIIYQNYTDIEIIIVNDGSTDNSLQIINDFATKDNRIRVINIKNSGRSVARNTGIEHSSGQFIMFVDADDELEENAIKNLYNAINDNDSDIAIGNTHVVYDVHQELKESDDWYFTIRHKGNLKITDKLIEEIQCCPWGKIFKRDIIDKYDLRFPKNLIYEDAFWHWAYLTSCNKITFINNIVYKYFRRKGSIMSLTYDRVEGLAIQHLYIIEKIFNFWKKNNIINCRYITALNLLEGFFLQAFKLSDGYEKIKAVYECARIAKKYDLPITKNNTINNICEGKLYFLFPDHENDNTISYSRYIQIVSFINGIFPKGSRRRKLMYFFAKFSYHLIKRLKYYCERKN